MDHCYARTMHRRPLELDNIEQGQLGALHQKYETLLRLRRERTNGAEVATQELAALARQFPSALRELEVLTEAQLKCRLEELALAPPWPHWALAMAAYHVTLRRLLTAKRWLGPVRCPSDDAVDRIVTLLSQEGSGLSRDRLRAEVRAAARPLNGRLSYQAATLVATRYGGTAQDLLDACFPTWRSARGVA